MVTSEAEEEQIAQVDSVAAYENEMSIESHYAANFDATTMLSHFENLLNEYDSNLDNVVAFLGDSTEVNRRTAKDVKSRIYLA